MSKKLDNAKGIVLFMPCLHGCERDTCSDHRPLRCGRQVGARHDEVGWMSEDIFADMMG